MPKIPFEVFEGLSKWHRAVGGSAVFDQGRLRLTDGLAGIEAPISESVGDFAISADRLFGPLVSVAGDVKIDRRGERVDVVAGNFRAHLPVLVAETVPQWPTPKFKAADWIAVKPDWWEAVQSVSFAAPEKAILAPALGGVLWRKTQVIAGDGVRVARATVKENAMGFLPEKLLAAGKASLHPPEAVTWAENRAWVRFPDGVTAWAILPAEPWPESILPAVTEISHQAGKTPWAVWAGTDARAAADRVAIFAAERVSFRAQEKGHVIFAVDSAMGTATEAVKAQVSKEYDVDANPKLLADAVERAPACALAKERDALVFRRPGFEMILMLMVRA